MNNIFIKNIYVFLFFSYTLALKYFDIERMNSMKKLFLTVLLIIIFVVSCGKKTADTNVIKIGVIAPLTGNYAQYGTAVKEGVELKVDAINNAGGINGKKIELIIADSKGDVQESVNALQKEKILYLEPHLRILIKELQLQNMQNQKV